MKALIYCSRFIFIFLISLGISGHLKAQSTPGSLTKLVGLTDIPGYLTDALVKDGYLYVGGYTYVNSVVTGYLRVYDFSTPSAPVFKAAVLASGKQLNAMMEENGFIYMVGDQGLVVYNISNPLSPTLAASHNCLTVGSVQKCFRDGYSNIAKSGNILFTNKNLWGMNLFNIANVQSPTFLDDFEFNFNTVRDYTPLSSSELLLNDGGGIRSVNFSNPSNIVVMLDTDARYLNLPGDTESWVLTTDKNTAYVYSWGTSFSLISVVDVPSRTLLASVDIKAHSSLGGRMKLNTNASKLFIGSMEFNITNRSTLTFVGYNTYDSPYFWDPTGNVLIAKRFNDEIWVMGAGGTVPAPVATAGTSITSSSFVASWNSVAGAASYRLDVSTNNFSTFVTGYNGKTVSGTSETVTGLSASTAYTYRVRAVNGTGTVSPNSNVISVTTSASGPSAPTITSFTPASGPVGTAVTISGTNFSTTLASNTVKFNGVTATVSASSATSITTSVPAGATTGAISVTVGANTATSATNFTVTTASAPGITSFTPTSGPVGTAVTITGTNFSTTPGNNTVKFNGVTAAVSASTATSITTTVPAGATTGTISVAVGANTATSSTNFTVTAGSVLSITTLSPAAGPVGTQVTIVGTSFSTTPASNTVKFNGVTAVVSASTATTITTSVPAGATSGTVSVTVGANTVTTVAAFMITSGPVATITSFTPTNGPVGTAVTISGTNFSTTPSNNEVQFNGVTATVSSSTATSITTSVPAGATTGTITVTVSGVTATSSMSFTVPTGPAPTITSIAPDSGPVGTSVTITGTNFSATPASNSVQFNGVTAAVSASTTTTITTSVPAGAVTGPLSVTVGGQVVTSATNFTVTGNAAPSITSFTPASGPVGTQVIITGVNFNSTAANNSVKFNGVTATVTASTPTTITTSVPAGASTGTITVTVGASTATSTSTFTVTQSTAPAITSFSPVTGTVGTSVTIVGVNFNATSASIIVKFGGVTANVSSNTATSISTTVPAGAVTGPISVTVGSETGVSSANFTVQSAPIALATFTPTSGPSGTFVTMTGSNFSSTPQNNVVKFNGTTAVVTASTATTLYVLVPNGATTGPITVTVGGQTTSSGVSFNVITCNKPAKPTITSSALDTETPKLTSSSATGNQWFLNGVPIANATAATLTVTAPGIYAVQATSTGGCPSDISDNFEMVVTGDISPLNSLPAGTQGGILFYPNPVTSKLIVEVPVPGPKTFRLYSTDGKSLVFTKFESEVLEVDVNQYETGPYYFVIHTVNGTKTGKILKK
jgi:hypothetical protein